MRRWIYIISLICFFVFVVHGKNVFAQTVSPTLSPAPSATTDNNAQLQSLNEKIRALEQKVADLKSQGNSLTSQISAMDTQIALTEYRIDATKRQMMDITLDIDSASKRMQNLEGSLDNVTKVLLNRIVTNYQVGGEANLQAFLTANNISELVTRANYLRLVQTHDRKLLYDTQQARNDYANQKSILENKKKKVGELNTQLQEYTKQLDQDKDTKKQLLVTTKNDEAHYQKMLADAKAQVAAMKSFTRSQGGSGSSLLPPQSSADGWFFSQRDSRWGNNLMGNSPETVWEVGCLVSSMAMVMKKHGVDVTPASIAANSSYFFSNTAYMLIPWGGGKFSSAWGNNQSAIDAKLAAGEPVIVGVKGSSHFVVLKSGSGGNYVMHDPWEGPDKNFKDYYSSISQYGWMN